MLAAPVSALTPRQRRVFFWLTTAALLLILLWAAQARALWPRWPVADPDTWGYLHPALSKLLGGPFEHTNGRNFVYPGFLYLILRATADFGAIPFAQHALGLASGVLLWTAWRQWRGWFAATSRLPAWADAALGLGLVAFYLRSASVIHFEMQIRPEGVFPFFAAVQLCLLLAFARAWWGEVRRPDRAAVLAGANLLAAALVYQLKPSYGLAVGVSALPVAWAVVFPWRQQDWRPRLRLVGARARRRCSRQACCSSCPSVISPRPTRTPSFSCRKPSLPSTPRLSATRCSPTGAAVFILPSPRSGLPSPPTSSTARSTAPPNPTPNRSRRSASIPTT